MPYDREDPRSGLAAASAGVDGEVAIAAPEYFEFRRLPPTEISALGSESWCVRAQNMAVVYTRLRAGDALRREQQEHEYAVVLPDSGGAVSFRVEGEGRDVLGESFVVVPPGRSEISALADTSVYRLFDCREHDILETAANADSYAAPHPRVAELRPWPLPEQQQLRIYPLSDVPEDPKRFGRIFRTSSFMVNLLPPQEGPRDPEKLSPHHHDDFEQLSLAVDGDWTHHIRTPWTSRKSRWREDEHRTVGSPSLAIIPPPTVHTSEAIGVGGNRLIDIFSPPRSDFSAKPGWVLNEADYPA